MNEKIIIISGASRGLGAAAARIVAQMGAAVALTARSQDDLQQVADEIKKEGGRAWVIPADISDEGACRAVIEQTVAKAGRIDALINNAGVLGPLARLADLESKGLLHNLAVNLLGPIMLTQAALPHLRRSEGRVINVSSGAAVKNQPGWGAYSVAKAALNHFNRQLAQEEELITAVAFRPGVVDTAMQRQIRREGEGAMDAEGHHKFKTLHDTGELLPPEKPGRALAALALGAPRSWSGEFMKWDAPKVQDLISTL